jgi:hypothetical protein
MAEFDSLEKFPTKRMWLNISQEALTCIDEFVVHGYLKKIKLLSEDYQLVQAVQVRLRVARLTRRSAKRPSRR